MKHSVFLSSTKRARSRRRGASMMLFLAALPVIIGACGLVVDMGNLYTRRSQAQRAADAAALAGAGVANEKDSLNTTVEAKVYEYALLNGYNKNAPGTQVEYSPEYKTDADGNGYISKVEVRVAREETVFFTPMLEGLLLLLGQTDAAETYSRRVSARASAKKVVRLNLDMGGVYGIADPSVSPSNQAVFGPDSYYNFGDPWNTRWLENGVTPNDRFKEGENQGGHEYTMKITSDYLQKYKNKVNVEIYDPDSYSTGGINGYDEYMPSNHRIQPRPNSALTETVYEIYKNGKLVNNNARATYGGYGGDAALAEAAGTNQQWVTPPNFNLDLSGDGLGAGDYTIRVKGLSGSTENGYRLRAGPPPAENAPLLTEAQWNELYGDKNLTDKKNVAVPIQASNHLQMNFTQGGMVKFQLGYVRAAEADGTIKVTHFDVDVGSERITYTCDTLPGQTFAGTLPPAGERDGVWSTDTIKLPEGYAGGNWSAEYVAGAQDTSSWELLGEGLGSGYVRLTE